MDSRQHLQGSRGATSAELLGVVVVVAAVIAALVTTPIGSSVGSGISAAICRVGGGACQAGGSASGTGDPGGAGDRRDTAREARGDRRDDARGQGGGSQPGTPGTPGGSPAIGVGDPVPGTSVPIPSPPAWTPSDPGAGLHGSQSPGVKDRATDAAAEAAANAMAGIWPHASRNLLHFLANSGKPLQQDVDAMLTDVPALASAVEVQRTNAINAAIAKAKASGATGPVSVPISLPWRGFYITSAMSKDWFYALGGVQYSVVGVVTVYPPDTPGGDYRYEATTRTVVRDQYNWDGGKATQIGPFTVTDEQLAELHRKGLAQEFTATGQSAVTTTKGQKP